MKLNFSNKFKINFKKKLLLNFFVSFFIIIYVFIFISSIFYNYSEVPHWDRLDFSLFAYEKIVNGDLIHLLYGHGAFDANHKPMQNFHSMHFIKWLNILDLYFFGGLGYLPSFFSLVSLLIFFYFFFYFINKLNVKNILLPLTIFVTLFLGFHNYWLYTELPSSTHFFLVFLFSLLSFYFNYLSFEKIELNLRYLNLSFLFSFFSIFSFTNGIFVFPLTLIQAFIHFYISKKVLNFKVKTAKFFIVILLFSSLYLILMFFLIPHLNSKEIQTFNKSYITMYEVFVNHMAMPFTIAIDEFANKGFISQDFVKYYYFFKKYIIAMLTFSFLSFYLYGVYVHLKNYIKNSFFDKINFFILFFITYLLLVLIIISFSRPPHINTSYGIHVSLLWTMLFFLYLKKVNVFINKYKYLTSSAVFFLFFLFLPAQINYLNDNFAITKLNRDLAALALKNNIYDEKKLISLYPVASGTVTKTSFFVKNRLSVWNDNKKYLEIRHDQNFFNYNCLNLYELPRDIKIERIQDSKEWIRISGFILLDKHFYRLLLDSNKKIVGQVFLKNENFLEKFKKINLFKSKQKINYYFEGYLIFEALNELSNFRFCSEK